MKYRCNPACSCGRCRVHGYMGPAVLITLGILFLLDQMGRAGWMEFGNTWPAILIVVGLVMFLQHSASIAGHVPRGYVVMQPGTPGYPAQPGVPAYSVQPPLPVVTPPPVSPFGSVTPGAGWNNPNDSEVRNG